MASIICLTDISCVPMATTNLAISTFLICNELLSLFGACSVLVLYLFGACPLSRCIYQHIAILQFVVFSHQEVAEEFAQETIVLADALGQSIAARRPVSWRFTSKTIIYSFRYRQFPFLFYAI